MNSQGRTGDGFERDKLFRAGLLAIEEKYLDYFIVNGRLQDHYIYFCVIATGTCYFSFMDDSNLPGEIRNECLELFKQVFG